MYKVLIVEDDPMVAMINEQFVSRHKDFVVAHKCNDGKSALEYLDENEVDLIILDVYMPYMDGFETLRQIRKYKESKCTRKGANYGKFLYKVWNKD